MKTEPYYLSSIDSSLLSNGWAKDDLIYQQNKTPQYDKNDLQRATSLRRRRRRP